MAERFPAVPDLTLCLRQLLSQVPAGKVTTCGDLAVALGNKVAATWIGYSSLHHDHKPNCTCHRIIRAGGMLGPFITTSDEKIRCLRDEGVVIQDGRVDWERFGFREFASDYPLEQLRQIQESIQHQILVQPDCRIPKLVGGVDVAYPNAEEGVAAYALVETATGGLVWSTTIRRRVVFPYISTYLSFREIPILLDLLDEVRQAGRMADVLMVDGSGILHHRHAGIASHLGVVASIPTIGVTKKLLCGNVDIEGMTPCESRPVVHEGRPIGIALRPTAGSRRPIFISPGHRVDLPFCEQLVRQLLTGHRLPEPIYWADRLSKDKKKGNAAQA
jgi:deoxyribonuclease V